MPLTFAALRQANLLRIPLYRNSRGELAHSTPDGHDWSPAQWLQALIGEVGEYANERKKFERGDLSFDEYAVKAGKELADVQTYLDILALRCLDQPGIPHPTGLALGRITVDKFNEVSRRVGTDVWLSDDVPPAGEAQSLPPDLADELRTVSKWLNEEILGPAPRREIAGVCSALQYPESVGMAAYPGPTQGSEYQSALRVVEAEHAIVDCVYQFIGRLENPEEDDPVQLLAQFTGAILPLIDIHLNANLTQLTLDSGPTEDYLQAHLEIDRLRRDCAEAYQVIGAALHGEPCKFSDSDVTRALDNLSAAASGLPRPHDDLLPWPGNGAHSNPDCEEPRP